MRWRARDRRADLGERRRSTRGLAFLLVVELVAAGVASGDSRAAIPESLPWRCSGATCGGPGVSTPGVCDLRFGQLASPGGDDLA
jgi:hypothetical protein